MDLDDKRRIAIIVDVGLGLLGTMMGLLWLAKAGDPNGMLDGERRVDAWRPLLPGVVGLALAAMVHARVRAAGAIGAVVWALCALAIVGTAIGSGKLGGGIVVFAIALVACAGIHHDLWRARSD